MNRSRQPFEVLGTSWGGRQQRGHLIRRMEDCRLVFYPHGSGQIVKFSLNRLDSLGALLHLAPLEYWRRAFPSSSRDGVDRLRAADHLIQTAKAAGEYDFDRVRARGCWRNENGFVLHLGDRLLRPEDNKFVCPREYSDVNHLYELENQLDGPDVANKLSDSECKELLWLFEEFGWAERLSGYVLAGWTVLAPFCGTLSRRPHVWITGASSATAVWDLVQPLLGDLGVRWLRGSNATEIERYHERNARPFVLEFSEPRWGARTRLRTLLHAASSSGGVHSMACFNSTREPRLSDYDRRCLSVLSTLGRDQPEYYRRLYQLRLNTDDRWARRLMGRTFHWLRSGQLDETIEICRDVASEVFDSPAAGDQIGILVGGAHVLMGKTPPDPKQVRRWLRRLGDNQT